MSSPVAAAAGSKRTREEEDESSPVAKEARVEGLEVDPSEPTGSDIWMEPRLLCDWKVVIKGLAAGPLTVHAHRFQLSKTSVWWAERIAEHMLDRESGIVFEDGGQWKTRDDVELYFAVVYGKQAWCVAPSLAGQLRLISALNGTYCLDAFETARKSVMYQLASEHDYDYKKEFARMPLADQVAAAKQHNWTDLLTHIASLVKPTAQRGAVAALPAESVRTLAPYLLDRLAASETRMRLAEKRVELATAQVDVFRDSFNGDKQEFCVDGMDCDCAREDHKVDHTATAAEHYDESSFETLSKIAKGLEFKWAPKKPAAAAASAAP